MAEGSSHHKEPYELSEDFGFIRPLDILREQGKMIILCYTQCSVVAVLRSAFWSQKDVC